MTSLHDTFASLQTSEDILALIQARLAIATVLITRPGDPTGQVCAHVGPPPPARFADGFPRAYSICRHVAAMNFTLIIDDAFTHPLLKDHPAVRELSVASYLGMPIRRADEDTQGSGLILSTLSTSLHRWSNDDIAVMRAGAHRLSAFIEPLHAANTD